MVGRPRKFDPDQVLEKAMATFWTNGYESTSMADLIHATGLHKGSLYQAFGSKHDLFIAALKRYLGNMRAKKNAILASAASPLEGLTAVLHAMLDIADAESHCPRGCMAVNALAELVPQDAEVHAIMEEHLSGMQTSMVDAISQGQAAKQIRPDRPPEQISQMLITFMSGLALELKGPLTKNQAHQLLDMQLASVL
jgi:TetR/AcrR family transcriptional repressor of nem operon